MTWAVLKFQTIQHVQRAYLRSQKLSSATTEAISICIVMTIHQLLSLPSLTMKQCDYHDMIT